MHRAPQSPRRDGRAAQRLWQILVGSIASASRSPNSRFVDGVYGKNPAALSASIGCPVPIRTRHRAASTQHRFLADGMEAKPGRQHQSFLRAAHRDVDAPFVVSVVHRSE